VVDRLAGQTTWAALKPLATRRPVDPLRPGRLRPPTDWKPAALGGYFRLYYVRFRTTAGGTAPEPGRTRARLRRCRGPHRGVSPFRQRRGRQRRRLPRRCGVRRRAAARTPVSGTSAACPAPTTARCAWPPTHPPPRSAGGPSIITSASWTGSRFATGLFMDNSEGKAPVRRATPVKPSPITLRTTAHCWRRCGGHRARWILATRPRLRTRRRRGAPQPGLLRGVRHPAAGEQLPAVRGLAELVAAPRGAERRRRRTPCSTATRSAAIRPTHGWQLATLAYLLPAGGRGRDIPDVLRRARAVTTWRRHWTAAAAFDVGQPVGRWSRLAEGQDPATRR